MVSMGNNDTIFGNQASQIWALSNESSVEVTNSVFRNQPDQSGISTMGSGSSVVETGNLNEQSERHAIGRVNRNAGNAPVVSMFDLEDIENEYDNENEPGNHQQTSENLYRFDFLS